MISARLAVENDIPIICSFDHIAQEEQQRREFIARSVRASCCYKAVIDNQIVGYGVFDYSFFAQGFISMLYVYPDYRRQGVGVTLMQHLEAVCSTAKLYGIECHFD